MAAKKTKSRLGRDPFEFVKKTSEEPEPPAAKKKPPAKPPAKPKTGKKTPAAKPKAEKKALPPEPEIVQKPAAAKAEREVFVEYDSTGTILATLEAGQGESGSTATARLVPQPNNMVEKFRFEDELLKLHTDYWVDVSKKPPRLVKR